jgi:hypothetical protein
MNFLLTPSENINELKKRISTLVHHPDDLRAFLKENGNMILDVLYDTITDIDTDKSVLRNSYFILSNLAWIDFIQSRFIIPSINLYLTIVDELQCGEIIYFLINVYYDDTFHQELMDSGFHKCLPKYIDDWDSRLKSKRGYVDNDYNEINILCGMLKLYIEINPEYNVDTMDTYHTLFSTCSNLSFNDVNDIKLTNCAREMYWKYLDAPQLHNEILFFLSNVYLDKDADVLVPDFNKYANHFITTYNGVYDDLIIDVLEIYKLNEFVPSVLDVAVQLLNDNLDNRKQYNCIMKFIRIVADEKESAEYICNHSITKRMIRYSMQTGIHIYPLTRTYSYFTSHRETELPCQFFYNEFIIPSEHRQIYPNYMLFSLSNILAVKDNFAFVDMNVITKFLRTCFYRYKDDSKLYTDLYHVIINLYDARYLRYILHDIDFIHVFKSWMCETEHVDDIGTMSDAYDIIKYICKTISQHDELHYIFNDQSFIDIVLDVATKTHVLHDIEQYLNCTLEQKCALLLYKKNMIKLTELTELDIHIHLMA